MGDKHTFVSISEELVDELADFCDQYIDEVIMRLMPDGRPFGMKKQTIKEELNDYLNIRGDAAKWWDWIADRIEYIERKKQEMLTPEQQKVVSAPDIVYRYALNYSAKMENELKRRKILLDDRIRNINTIEDMPMMYIDMSEEDEVLEE